MIWSLRTIWRVVLGFCIAWILALIYIGFITFQNVNKSEYIPNGFRIFTPGCQIKERKDPIENSVNPANIGTNFCKEPLTRISYDGKHIIRQKWIDRIISHYNYGENWRNIKCEYIPIHRIDDKFNSYGNETIKFNLDAESIQIIPIADFVRVNCYDTLNKNFYTDYHLLLQTSPFNFETYKKMTSVNNFLKDEKRFSVLLMGIDGVSLANVKERLPRTLHYLHLQPNFLEFKGFTNIRRSGFLNMITVLTGHKMIGNYTDEKSKTKISSKYLDNENFIWKHFGKSKFLTVFAENSARNSLFDREIYEFKQQPTDYYLYPLLLELKKKNHSTNASVQNCIDGYPESQLPLEVAKKLLVFYKNFDFFSLYWLSKPNAINYFNDKEIVETLIKMNEHKLFEKTFVFIIINESKTNMGDKVQPLLLALYPTSFVKYETSLKYFKRNSQRLITPIDLHATLLDIVYENYELVKETGTEMSHNVPHKPSSLSLFKIHDKWRTCEDANIPMDLCYCTASD